MSDRVMLHILEDFDLVGTWSWNFIENEHIWSPGLFRILGLSPRNVRADYQTLLSLVHPEDQASVTSAAEVLQTGWMAQQTFRIIRPNGSLRTLRSRGEVVVAPDGRPLQAKGVLIDVSDHEAMARARTAEQRRRRSVFRQLGAFTSVSRIYPYNDFSTEWIELVGLTKDELLDEPTRPILKTERARWRDYGRMLYLEKRLVNVQPRLVLATGDIVPYRMVMVPMRDAIGTFEGWANYIAPLTFAEPVTGGMRQCLDQLVDAAHLRAGRALLDWSMQQLAAASGVSMSTVRRLESGDPVRNARTRSSAVMALRENGIRFMLMNDGAISVSKSTGSR